MAFTKVVLDPGGTNNIGLDKLTDNETGLLVTGAVVTATVYDDKGVVVTGVAFPVTIPDVGGKPGSYRVTLATSLAVIAGNYYRISFKVVFGGQTQWFACWAPAKASYCNEC